MYEPEIRKRAMVLKCRLFRLGSDNSSPHWALLNSAVFLFYNRIRAHISLGSSGESQKKLPCNQTHSKHTDTNMIQTPATFWALILKKKNDMNADPNLHESGYNNFPFTWNHSGLWSSLTVFCMFLWSKYDQSLSPKILITHTSNPWSPVQS